MNKIFTDSRIAELDRYTIEHEPISSEDLIERASRTFCNEFVRSFSPGTLSVVIFAGPGNNGADGLTIGRILVEEGYRVHVFLFDKNGQASQECRNKRDLYVGAGGGDFSEVEDHLQPPFLSADTVVIDALFGTGLNRPLQGGYEQLVRYINDSEATVVAVDIPSGLFPEDNYGNNPEAIIQADYTYTFEFPKLSFFFAENADFVGEIRTLPIGLSAEGKKKIPSDFLIISDADIALLLPKRLRFSHKGDYGHALLIAGSSGMMGAAVLGARAAMHSGLGKLTCQVPACGEAILQTAVPEAVLKLDPHNKLLSQCIGDIEPFVAIGVGPGIGQDPDTAIMLAELLEKNDRPMVIDADALNIIAENPSLLEDIPKNSILTPHPGELQRLTKTNCKKGWDALIAAKQLAQKIGCYVVLKGAYSATCTPRGLTIFNTTGNPGMATAGSGDVLTGVILSFLAQGYEPVSAAVLGNYMHGLSGDIFAGLQSEASLVASDLVEHLSGAFRQFR